LCQVAVYFLAADLGDQLMIHTEHMTSSTECIRKNNRRLSLHTCCAFCILGVKMENITTLLLQTWD